MRPSKNLTRLGNSANLSRGSRKFTVNKFSDLNPGAVALITKKLFKSSPALANRISASAVSVMTKRPRTRLPRELSVADRPDSRKASLRSGAADIAGITPNRIPVTSDSSIVNMSTHASVCVDSTRGI